jgi:hypothetical protein
VASLYRAGLVTRWVPNKVSAPMLHHLLLDQAFLAHDM